MISRDWWPICAHSRSSPPFESSERRSLACAFFVNFHIFALATGEFTLDIGKFKEGFDKNSLGIGKSLPGIDKFALGIADSDPGIVDFNLGIDEFASGIRHFPGFFSNSLPENRRLPPTPALFK